MFKILETDEFKAWIKGLNDVKTQRRLNLRLAKARLGNLGDHASVGDGVMEMREHFGPGWRMYYLQQGDVLIIMLGGGDKSSQEGDIAEAKEVAKALED